MSVHDALEAWQAGEITAGRAVQMTGSTDVMELHALAYASGVEIRTSLLAREDEQVAAATAMIRSTLQEQHELHPGPGMSGT